MMKKFIFSCFIVSLSFITLTGVSLSAQDTLNTNGDDLSLGDGLISNGVNLSADRDLNMNIVDYSPYSLESRDNYGAGIRKCRAALIAPSWILTARHCIGSKKVNNIEKHGWVRLHYYDESGVKQIVRYNSKAVFRHPGKDIGLMQLTEAVKEDLIEPVLLLSTPILKKHGYFNMKKVSANIFKDIPVRAGRRSNAFVSKPDRGGKAGSSGAPWVFESETVGDVLFAVTHGSGRAPQVAYVKNWINDTVEANDSSVQLNWVTLETVFPDRFNQE